jgi:hypothetical protein
VGTIIFHVNIEQDLNWFSYIEIVIAIRITLFDVSKFLLGSYGIKLLDYDYQDIDRANQIFFRVYACAVYMVSVDEMNERWSTLVAAKARVCPLKNVSIPRLELQSATLASRLTHSVKRESDYVVEKSYYWSDSKTVLAWIRADPRTFNLFTALIFE